MDHDGSTELSLVDAAVAVFVPVAQEVDNRLLVECEQQPQLLDDRDLALRVQLSLRRQRTCADRLVAGGVARGWLAEAVVAVGLLPAGRVPQKLLR